VNRSRRGLVTPQFGLDLVEGLAEGGPDHRPVEAPLKRDRHPRPVGRPDDALGQLPRLGPPAFAGPAPFHRGTAGRLADDLDGLKSILAGGFFFDKAIGRYWA
jgi:hypothetical protein